MNKEETVKVIKLELDGRIEISLCDFDGEKWGGGTITSNLKDVCEYCDNPDCDMDCSDFIEYCSDRDTDAWELKQEESISFRAYNNMIDAIESLILAHAIAGVDIESSSYLEGIETTIDAIGNNI